MIRASPYGDLLRCARFARIRYRSVVYMVTRNPGIRTRAHISLGLLLVLIKVDLSPLSVTQFV